MPEKCIGNCLACGKCANINFSILDSFEAGNVRFEPGEGYGIALDIGTTSVVLALLDLSTGRTAARHSFMNPQRAFGPDVISRISAANGGRLEELRLAIAGAVAEGVKTLVASVPGGTNIKSMVIAGNTTMMYLLLGLPCESLGVYPFEPAYKLAESYDFAGIFGGAGFNFPVTILPWFGAFVGGDVLAGLSYLIPRNNSRFVLIDLGTNGEMALYNNGELTVTSTAAGPAFEGGRHGGDSDTLALLAKQLRECKIDETGFLEDEENSPFTQKEVRDLQLAKSAVRSGFEILLESAGLDYDSLGAVYLSGGIGQAIDVECAFEAGLLPSELRGKVLAAGNSSLGGAALLLLTGKAAGAEKLIKGAEEINLSAHPKFNQYFMEFMYFA